VRLLPSVPDHSSIHHRGQAGIACVAGSDEALLRTGRAFFLRWPYFWEVWGRETGATYENLERDLEAFLAEAGVPRLMRTKHLASSGPLAETVRRELGLTLGYIRETLGIDGELGVEVFAENPALGREIEDWRAAQTGVSALPVRPTPAFAVSGAEARLGAERIQPMWAMIAEDRP